MPTARIRGDTSSTAKRKRNKTSSAFVRSEVRLGNNASVTLAIPASAVPTVANEAAATNNNEDDDDDLTHERSVFRSIINRVDWSTSECNAIPKSQKTQTTKTLVNASAVPLLTEGGVAAALRTWLLSNDLSTATTNGGNAVGGEVGGGKKEGTESEPIQHASYPTCHLPPPKSCNVTTYTLVLMSHNTERLEKLMGPLTAMIDSWPGLTEVILVWNSLRISLLDVANGKVNGRGKSNEIKHAAQLVAWDADPNHPFRVFFSLEEGLTNNLLNRYHPKIAPVNEAVMYFDDDGPFWSVNAMAVAGFELWKRNSNVQVGGFPRNVRFLSKRMTDLGKAAVGKSHDFVTKKMGEGSPPPFTPTCRNITGDVVEYNYFVFPDFDAHVLLPSGTFLHRNLLCFVWHPAFEELRRFVTEHPTHPDDMTVSTLVSHLVGRAPRVFPKDVEPRAAVVVQKVKEEGNKVENNKKRQLTEMEESEFETIESFDDKLGSPALVDQHHRRLLWKQKNWGPMREEAINSIIGYFGSIHPGTVGWCAGTPYMKKNNKGVSHVCKPEKPSLDLIPWLNEGGVGFNQCP